MRACGFKRRFAANRVPTLEDAVQVLSAEGLRANVEIKAPPGREATTAHATGRTLLRCWPTEMPLPIVSSFAPECLKVLQEVAPDLPRALLRKAGPADWREQLRSLGCEGLHCHHEAAAPCLVSAVRAEGFACRVYTVNDAVRAAELAAIGVDAIVTDYPDRLFFCSGSLSRASKGRRRLSSTSHDHAAKHRVSTMRWILSGGTLRLSYLGHLAAHGMSGGCGRQDFLPFPV